MFRPSVEKRYIKYSQHSKGDVLIEGIFQRSESNRFGTTHLFLDRAGTAVVLNSAGQLNANIKNYLSPGTVARITYMGKIVLERGPMTGRESHQFSMEVDYVETRFWRRYVQS